MIEIILLSPFGILTALYIDFCLMKQYSLIWPVDRSSLEVIVFFKTKIRASFFNFRFSVHIYESMNDTTPNPWLGTHNLAMALITFLACLLPQVLISRSYLLAPDNSMICLTSILFLRSLCHEYPWTYRFYQYISIGMVFTCLRRFSSHSKFTRLLQNSI